MKNLILLFLFSIPFVSYGAQQHIEPAKQEIIIVLNVLSKIDKKKVDKYLSKKQELIDSVKRVKDEINKVLVKFYCDDFINTFHEYTVEIRESLEEEYKEWKTTSREFTDFDNFEMGSGNENMIESLLVSLIDNYYFMKDSKFERLKNFALNYLSKYPSILKKEFQKIIENFIADVGKIIESK